MHDEMVVFWGLRTLHWQPDYLPLQSPARFDLMLNV